jgi:hypothetical protein
MGKRFFKLYNDNNSPYSNDFFKDVYGKKLYTSSNTILIEQNITTKEEWKSWIVKNHPDKGGDTNLFITMLKMGRIEFE